MNLIMLLSPASCYLFFGRIYLYTMFSNTSPHVLLSMWGPTVSNEFITDNSEV
jgi:hypothetical protein